MTDRIRDYEATKAAREISAATPSGQRGEKMTLRDYEAAIHKLLDEAVASGLEPSDLVDCGVAIIENTFLDDPQSA